MALLLCNTCGCFTYVFGGLGMYFTHVICLILETKQKIK